MNLEENLLNSPQNPKQESLLFVEQDKDFTDDFEIKVLVLDDTDLEDDVNDLEDTELDDGDKDLEDTELDDGDKDLDDWEDDE